MKANIKLDQVGAVCDNCAIANDFTRKNKCVGVWVGKCEICGKTKACTDLWHDWNPPKKGTK